MPQQGSLDLLIRAVRPVHVSGYSPRPLGDGLSSPGEREGAREPGLALAPGPTPRGAWTSRPKSQIPQAAGLAHSGTHLSASPNQGFVGLASTAPPSLEAAPATDCSWFPE